MQCIYDSHARAVFEIESNWFVCDNIVVFILLVEQQSLGSFSCSLHSMCGVDWNDVRSILIAMRYTHYRDKVTFTRCSMKTSCIWKSLCKRALHHQWLPFCIKGNKNGTMEKPYKTTNSNDFCFAWEWEIEELPWKWWPVLRKSMHWLNVDPTEILIDCKCWIQFVIEADKTHGILRNVNVFVANTDQTLSTHKLVWWHFSIVMMMIGLGSNSYLTVVHHLPTTFNNTPRSMKKIYAQN